MTDVFGIFVSGMMMLIVIFRAVQLDGKLPWFQRTPTATGAEAEPGSIAARQGGGRGDHLGRRPR